MIEQIQLYIDNKLKVEYKKLIIENNELRAENKRLNAENKNLKDQITNHLEDIRDLRKNITQLREENHELRCENRKLYDELDKANKKIENIEEQLAQANKKIEHIEERLSKSEGKHEKITIREIMTQLEGKICDNICAGITNNVIYRNIKNLGRLAEKNPEINKKFQETLDHIGEKTRNLIDLYKDAGNDIVHKNRSGILSLNQIKKEIYDDLSDNDTNDLIFNEFISVLKEYNMIDNDIITFN